jgi:hypothetical protein
MGLAFAELEKDRQAQASTMAWILVVNPPRERPMQRDRVCFFAVGRVLVHPNGRRIDHLDIAVVSL